MRNILQSFLQATKILSGQTYPTLLSAFYIHRLLLHYFEEATDDHPITIALKQSLKFWFDIYYRGKLPAGQMDMMVVINLFVSYLFVILLGNATN